jgi:hypothetical protein
MSVRNGKAAVKRTAKVPKGRRSVRKLLPQAYPSERKAKSLHLNEEPPPYSTRKPLPHGRPFTTIDLFCGAGGITQGFRLAGFHCLYANDINHWAIETFRANHPGTRADNRPIEQVDAAALRRELNLEPGELDVIVGGPPCQGFSINAPERFLEDPRNSLFKHYIRHIRKFERPSFVPLRTRSYSDPFNHSRFTSNSIPDRWE